MRRVHFNTFFGVTGKLVTHGGLGGHIRKPIWRRSKLLIEITDGRMWDDPEIYFRPQDRMTKSQREKSRSARPIKPKTYMEKLRRRSEYDDRPWTNL